MAWIQFGQNFNLRSAFLWVFCYTVNHTGFLKARKYLVFALWFWSCTISCWTLWINVTTEGLRQLYQIQIVSIAAPQWRHSHKELFNYFCNVCNTGGKKHNWINASNLLKSTGTAIRWRKKTAFNSKKYINGLESPTSITLIHQVSSHCKKPQQ